MSLSPHTALALAGSALVSAIALTDAVTLGLTGHNSIFVEDSTHTGWLLAGVIVHGLTYTALLWVLVVEKQRFETANKFARFLRYALTAAMCLLVIGFLLIGPVLGLTGAGYKGTIWTWFVSIGFAGMIVFSLLLGIAVVRRNPLGIGGRVLGAMLPVFVIMVLLNLLAPDWAHPAYLEVTIAFGIALLGVSGNRSAIPVGGDIQSEGATVASDVVAGPSHYQ